MIVREERIGGQRLILGDCLERMAELPDNSVDSVVTDPPYGLSFMGKRWDYDVPSVEIWAECLRVLKPGGHLLAFAGTRTQHRMAVRIEDAGFEIRDMIAWVYGSGFPKSLDVSKAIDKAAGVEREVVGFKANTMHDIRGGKLHTGVENNRLPSPITTPATPESAQWAGWGTALKPALEPITLARKPLCGTVAANVLKWRTGALNIDGSRVEAEPRAGWTNQDIRGGQYASNPDRPRLAAKEAPEGRWPANLIHDGSDEVVGLFPVTSSRPGKTKIRGESVNVYSGGRRQTDGPKHDDTGSAARFFYCAKASKRDRDEGNIHPTVKPTDLMRYLCRLVTPPGGVVLDPFMGSGSTGKAAELEGFRFIGIERDPEYFNISRHRIAAAWAASLQKGFDL